MKYLFLDVETTGINPYEHSVVQIAALVEVNGEIIDQLIIDIAPIPGSKIDPEALAITGKTKEEIENYPSASEQLETFTQFLQKHIGQYDKKDKLLFIAYNAPFDYEFMRAFFIRQNNKFFGSYFWNPAIDVMTLAMEKLKNQRAEMNNFKLSTVANFVGIDIDSSKLHDAYYDIMLTYELYKKVTLHTHNISTIEKILPSTKIENTLLEKAVEPTKEFKDSLF